MLSCHRLNPKNIPNMTAWFKRNNYVLGSWVDSLGLATAVTAAGSLRPTATNGTPVFDGVDDVLKGGAISELWTAAAKTCFVVAKSDVSATNIATPSYWLNTGIISGVGEYVGIHHRGGSNLAQLAHFPAVAVGNEHAYTAASKVVFEFRHTAAANWRSRVNSGTITSISSGGSTQVVSGALWFGQSGAGAGTYMTGSIYEVLTWNRDLSNFEADSVHQYLRNVHGV